MSGGDEAPHGGWLSITTNGCSALRFSLYPFSQRTYPPRTPNNSNEMSKRRRDNEPFSVRVYKNTEHPGGMLNPCHDAATAFWRSTRRRHC